MADLTTAMNSAGYAAMVADAVEAMAWIWGYDAVASWDRQPVVPAVAQND